MKVCLMTFNAKYIHKALALRWLYVARDPAYETEIVEYTLRDDLEECLIDLLQRNPDVVGCSVYIWNAEIMKRWIPMLHQARPDLRIILGGPEVTYQAEEWLQLPIECILRGEGEKTFWQAVRNEEKIDGYLSREKRSAVQTAKTDLRWLEQLESPYFLDFDIPSMAHRYFYFETSRGCPYHCSYCLSSLENQVRFFSEEYLMKQLEQLEHWKVKQVKLLDRTFNASDDFSYRFVQKIEAMKMETSFQFEIVADTLSERMLNFLMSEATVKRYRFEIGIQSFHLPTLEAVHRKQDLDRCRNVIQLLTQRGFALHVDLIGGLPWEDLTTFERSFNTLFQTGVREIQVGLLKMLKGTQLRQQAEEYGMIYQKTAPYTILSTFWLSEKEIKQIEAAYHATEKLYNSGRCFRSLHRLTQLGLIQSPFKILIGCGMEIEKIQNIQVRDYFLILYHEIVQAASFTDEQIEWVKAVLADDYSRQFKQRTKKLFDWNLKKELCDKIRITCLEKGWLSEQTVYNYTEFALGWCLGKPAIQLLVYSRCQALPKRIYFDKEGRILKDERNLDCNDQFA